MTNEDAIAASVRGAQAERPSPEAIVAADKIRSLDVFTSDKWIERRELTPLARRVVALVLDAFAAQAVETDRQLSNDYYESHEALADLVQLWSEYEVLNGGGPGWRERFKEAFDRACELTRKEP